MLRSLYSIGRIHILSIAVAGQLTFGWLLTGRFLWVLCPFVAIDWFAINLLNRITDIAEDLANRIDATQEVARLRRPLLVLLVVLVAGSLLASAILHPALLPFRLLVLAIGAGYSLRFIPSRRGRLRFKDLYVFKNLLSAVIFTLTGFAYPLAVAPRAASLAAAVVLAGFFLLYEQTYEILYDLRDLEGDRRERVPTYPAVHGETAARRIIDGLLAASSAVLLGGLLAGAVGVREALMLGAPPLQLLWARRHPAVTPRDCVRLTWLGAALLAFYLVGNQVWLRLGLPANIYL